MIDRDLARQVLAAAMARGADFAEIYAEQRRTTSVVCEDDRVEKIFSGQERGAGVRVIRGGSTAYAFTNDLSPNSLLQAARVAARVAGGVQGGELADLRALPAGGEAARPGQVAIERKTAWVKAANAAARAAGAEVRQVMVALGDIEKSVMIANSLGEWLEDEAARVRLTVNVVAAADGIIQTGMEAIAASSGWEVLEETSPEELAQKAAARALLMLKARPCPAARMPVILSSRAGGTMVHEACGHGLEADLVQKGLSVYAGKIGSKVAAECVSVVDDATLPGRYGSFRFDDEGVPAQRTVLIERGVLVGFMYDRLTAGKDGVPSTGNGRRESYQHKPIPRMTNTLIAPGGDDPGAIIAGTRRALLVVKMGGGQVNTTNGDFVFDVPEAYMIENGEVAYPVRGATLIGNGPQVLQDIEAVGSDLGFSVGQCGKDGQAVPVADAQPTLRIRQLTVGGTSV